MRKGFKEKINENFPKLRKEIKDGGMAEFLTEVAIDVTLINGGDNEDETRRGSRDPEPQESVAQV